MTFLFPLDLETFQEGNGRFLISTEKKIKKLTACTHLITIILSNRSID